MPSCKICSPASSCRSLTMARYLFLKTLPDLMCECGSGNRTPGLQALFCPSLAVHSLAVTLSNTVGLSLGFLIYKTIQAYSNILLSHLNSLLPDSAAQVLLLISSLTSLRPLIDPILHPGLRDTEIGCLYKTCSCS